MVERGVARHSGESKVKRMHLRALHSDCLTRGRSLYSAAERYYGSGNQAMSVPLFKLSKCGRAGDPPFKASTLCSRTGCSTTSSTSASTLSSCSRVAPGGRHGKEKDQLHAYFDRAALPVGSSHSGHAVRLRQRASLTTLQRAQVDCLVLAVPKSELGQLRQQPCGSSKLSRANVLWWWSGAGGCRSC